MEQLTVPATTEINTPFLSDADLADLAPPTPDGRLTFEHIFSTNGQQPIYAIAACPTWQHYDANELPRPIRDWLALNAPTVEIERLSDYQYEFPAVVEYGPHENHRISLSDIPRPIFRLGLDEEQANRFQRDWLTGCAEDLGVPGDFYFICFGIPWATTGHNDNDCPIGLRVK